MQPSHVAALHGHQPVLDANTTVTHHMFVVTRDHVQILRCMGAHDMKGLVKNLGSHDSSVLVRTKARSNTKIDEWCHALLLVSFVVNPQHCLKNEFVNLARSSSGLLYLFLSGQCQICSEGTNPRSHCYRKMDSS